MTYIRFSLLFFLICWQYNVCQAQVYNVTKYTTEDGLVQSQVFASMQDNAGYLWLGTHRGICRFDGRNFRPYGLREGLADNFINDLIHDDQGLIWIATDKGLNRFDGSHFSTYTTQNGLSENGIECLYLAQNGAMLLGTHGKGIMKMEGETFQANPYNWEDQGGHERTVFCLLEDQGGALWIGTDLGLYHKSANENLIRSMAPEFNRNQSVNCFLRDSRDGLWIGTDLGLFRWDGRQFFDIDMRQTGLNNLKVLCLAEDEQGKIWIGTDRGVAYFNPNPDGNYGLHYLERKDGLLNVKISSALIDTEGNIWFGTDGHGLRKLTEGIFEVLDKNSGLNSNLAKSFLQDKAGRIWICTKDRGISVFEGDEVVRKYVEKDGLGGEDIVTTFTDSQGNFWFTSYNGSLTCYDERGFVSFGNSDSLICNATYCVSEDPAGAIWVGTDNGVYIFKDNSIIRHLGLEEGLSHKVVYSLKQDFEGNMWVGTADGLNIWDGDRFRSYPVDNAIGPNVITLLEDPSRRMWVGSAIGLAYFEAGKDTARWVRISGAPGAHTVVGFVLEANRYLWVGTENGAYRLDLDKFDPSQPKAPFEHYTQKDGLPSLECNANAAFEDADGNIWLGTAEGAIRRPAGMERNVNDLPPRIYITGVRSAAHNNWIEAMDSMTNRTAPKLDYTDNQLDFEFVGISLKSPQQVEYKYRLNNQAWSRSRRETNVSIASLGPGEYTFEVMAKKEGSSWNEENSDQFQFEIRPPIFYTWWFLTIMTLIFSGIGYGIYRGLTARRRRETEEQAIRDKAEKLALEHQALYAMMNPHFTFNALQSIQFFIHRQDKIAANKFLSSFAKLVRKNLESTKSDTISLGEEVERLKLYLSLEKMRFPEKFDYEVVVEPGLDLSDTQIPPMLLQPFVENSIKHGIMSLESDGEIEVRIEKESEDHLRILVIDNGIGIEASKKRKQNRPSDHVSKGMQITMDRLALFARMTGKEYSLHIQERKEEDKVLGTQVDMLLPIKE